MSTNENTGSFEQLMTPELSTNMENNTPAFPTPETIPSRAMGPGVFVFDAEDTIDIEIGTPQNTKSYTHSKAENTSLKELRDGQRGKVDSKQPVDSGEFIVGKSKRKKHRSSSPGYFERFNAVTRDKESKKLKRKNKLPTAAGLLKFDTIINAPKTKRLSLHPTSSKLTILRGVKGAFPEREADTILKAPIARPPISSNGCIKLSDDAFKSSPPDKSSKYAENSSKSIEKQQGSGDNEKEKENISCKKHSKKDHNQIEQMDIAAELQTLAKSVRETAILSEINGFSSHHSARSSKYYDCPRGTMRHREMSELAIDCHGRYLHQVPPPCVYEYQPRNIMYIPQSNNVNDNQMETQRYIQYDQQVPYYLEENYEEW